MEPLSFGIGGDRCVAVYVGLAHSVGRIIKEAAHHRHVGSSDRLHVPRVGLVLQGLHVHEAGQLHKSFMAHTHVHGCCHSLADDDKGTLPAFSSSIRSDDSVEFSTAPHVVQYVSNRYTRPRRRSIARIFSIGSLHSRHARPFTSADSMLHRTNVRHSHEISRMSQILLTLYEPINECESIWTILRL